MGEKMTQTNCKTGNSRTIRQKPPSEPAEPVAVDSTVPAVALGKPERQASEEGRPDPLLSARSGASEAEVCAAIVPAPTDDEGEPDANPSFTIPVAESMLDAVGG